MKIENIGVTDLATDPRASLGDQVPFFFYRYLSLFAVADSKGAGAKNALYEGGRRLGTQLVKEMMYRDFAGIAQHYEQNGMGIVVLESQEGAVARVRISECATCTGLPPVEMSLCYFDGGILAGALEAIAGSAEPYGALEVECAGRGNASCLFEIGPSSQIAEEE